MSAITIGVAIPCTATHLACLPEALESLERQTVPPAHVAVAVSSAVPADCDAIGRLELRFRGLGLSFVIEPAERPPGANRQAASALLSSDVIAYQDADDLSHPQRLEIITEIFSRGDVLHLVHTEALEKRDFDAWSGRITRARFLAALASFKRHYSRDDVVNLQCVESSGEYHGIRSGHIAHGKPAVRRSVLDHVRWGLSRRGEDKAFNTEVAGAFPGQSVYIDCCLYLYRNSLSTYSGDSGD